MPRFCAHLGYQFTEVPLAQRCAQAAASGFTAVEHPAPYVLPASHWTDALQRHGQTFVQFALPMGNPAAGDKGIGCHPGREAEWAAGIDRALGYAQALGCTRVHAMAGIVPAGVSHETAQAVYLENLRTAARRLEPFGITVLMEAINSQDVPSYLVDRPSVGLALIERSGCPNVRLLLDTYHASVMGEPALEFARAHLTCVGHVQVADHPGRHEPGTGTLPLREFFALLDERGYDGFVGCEYLPAGRTEAGLGWLRSVAG